MSTQPWYRMNGCTNAHKCTNDDVRKCICHPLLTRGHAALQVQCGHTMCLSCANHSLQNARCHYCRREVGSLLRILL